MITNEDLILVYATTPDLATAEKIAHQLIEEKLVACANILPGMKSIYPWEGKIETSNEAVLILKTRKTLWSALEARYAELHPYEIPCLLEIPVTAAHDPYRRWLLSLTRR